MKRNLVICPNCTTRFKTEVRKYKGSGFGIEVVRQSPKPLGEMVDGVFKVLRFHNNYTNIVGKDFAVVCDVCKEHVYIRKEDENGTNGNIGIKWLFSESFIGTLGSAL